MDLKQRQMVAVVAGVVCAVTLLLLFFYVRQRLFTQAEPIVLAA